ncbi:CHAT domain-containing tetratricopeptide repeat protein [Kitasatospora sp. NPDC054939]
MLLQFSRTGEAPALDAAISLYREYLRTSGGPGAPGPRGPSESERALAAAASNLLAALLARWQARHERADLDEIVTLAGERAHARPPAEQDVRILGLALRDRFGADGDPADLDRAVAAFGLAVELPQDPEVRAQTLSSLGGVLRDRFEATGSARDLEAAERAERRAAEAAPVGSATWVAAVGNLAVTRYRTYRQDGDRAALAEALELLRELLPACPPGSAHRPRVLHNLAEVLRTSAEQSDDPGLRAEMLSVHRTALREAPPGHPARPDRLAWLGVALRLTAEATDDLVALRESAELLRAAVRLLPPGTERHATALNSLGNALHRLAQYTGDTAVLDEAVAALRRGLTEARPGAAHHADLLANLAVTLRERYLETGDLASLEEGAALAREALAGAGPVAGAVRLGNLGVVLQSWYGRTGDPATLGEAVDAAREALARTASDDPAIGDRLNHLANALRERFGATGEQRDLDEAIALLERAADAIPYGRPALALALSNLGSARLTKHRTADAPGVLERAVSDLGRAVWATEDGSAAHAGYLCEYGDALHALYERGGDRGVLRAAEDAYRQAALTEALAASDRVGAAWDWGAAAAGDGRWDDALEGHRLALDLLPFAASGRIARGDQQHRLARLYGLAAEAAACAVNAGRPEEAVQLLEQGRGVLLGRAMASRDGWGRLREEHPDLAERFQELRDRLDTLEPDTTDPLSGDTDLRHSLARRFEHLVGEIRTRPGLADFLAPPSTASLLATAADGPVVLAYCSPHRSDALVLRPGGVLLVPLPRATPRAVAEQTARLDEALAAAIDPEREQQAQGVLREVLAWTWDCVTEPVLDALGLAGPGPDGRWPRIWWSPGGALAALPLHAAGRLPARADAEPSDAVPDTAHAGADTLPDTALPDRVGDGPARTVLDRVVSSYTPTVRALAYARARSAAAPEPAGPGTPAGPETPDGSSPRRHPAAGLLAVALPDTPGARPLTGAKREVDLLGRLLPTEVLTGERATAARILAALPHHAHVHFACHGVSDPVDPSNTRLLAHDHRAEALTVRRISRLDLPVARLAVLSACDTARGSEELADEAVHITSAFQLAGYPHTVGTLWPVHDLVAVRVTRLLYGALRTGGPTEPGVPAPGPAVPAGPGLDTRRTAEALHHAVRHCRDAFPESPSLWAAHIHAGA